MSILLTPAELETVAPGEVWIDDVGRGWSDIGIRGYRYAPVDAPASSMREHALVLYVRGEARITRCASGHEETDVVEPGDISLNRAHTSSTWKWDAPIDVLHIYLDPLLLERVACEVYGPSVAPLVLVDRLKVRDPAIVLLGEALVREARSELPGSRLFARALGEQLALHLVRHHVTMHPAAGGSGSGSSARFAPSRIERIQRFVNEHLGDDLSLASIAESVGLRTHHFARLFRNTFAMSPHQFVLKARLDRATELLRDVRRSIGEVADMTGFADQSHLTRCFKRRYGTSPHRWRRDSIPPVPGKLVVDALRH